MKFAKSFQIFDDFITESEESSFISEMEPHLKRHIYEKDHWDDVSLGKASIKKKKIWNFPDLVGGWV